MGEAAEGAPVSTAVPATGAVDRVARNHLGDGAVQEYSAFTLADCGICPRDSTMDWRSDFSNSFLGEREACTYAPSMLRRLQNSFGYREESKI